MSLESSSQISEYCGRIGYNTSKYLRRPKLQKVVQVQDGVVCFTDTNSFSPGEDRSSTIAVTKIATTLVVQVEQSWVVRVSEQ